MFHQTATTALKHIVDIAVADHFHHKLMC